MHQGATIELSVQGGSTCLPEVPNKLAIAGDGVDR